MSKPIYLMNDFSGFAGSDTPTKAEPGYVGKERAVRYTEQWRFARQSRQKGWRRFWRGDAGT